MEPRIINKYSQFFFDLELDEINFEPLQPSKIDTYTATQVIKHLKFDIFRRLIWKLNFHKAIRPLVRIRMNKINGHTTIAVYTNIVKLILKN